MAEPARLRETSPPFLRLNPSTGWRLAPKAQRPGVPYETGPLRLALEGSDPNPLGEPFGSFGGRSLPRGLAISGEGRLFLADPDGRVIWSAQGDLSAAGFRPLWPAAPEAQPGACDLSSSDANDPYHLQRPTDLALAPNGDLVITDPGAGRVIVITWPQGQLRQVIPSDAVAVGFDAWGRAYLAGPSGLQRYDRAWRRDPDFPHPAVHFGDLRAVAAPCACAFDCACDCDGAPCGCDSAAGPTPVIHLLDGAALVSLSEAGRVLDMPSEPLCLSPGPIRFGAPPLWDDPRLPGHEPLALTGLEIGSDGRHPGTGLPLMSVPRRVSVPRSGRLVTQAIDGGQPGFAWDRLGLVMDLPRNSRMVIRTLTSDSPIEIDRIALMPDGAWSVPLALEPGMPGELLIQSPPGRYLWLWIELYGDGRATPQITEIDIFGPRRSGLRHLPAAFHQDPESARFLDRFLSYFDVIFAETSRTYRDMAGRLDPHATPSEFLDWLGAWFDWDFAASLPEPTRREMIAGAMGYFRERGTVAGLRRILQWHLGLEDPMPQIIEHFRLAPLEARMRRMTRAPVMIGGAALGPGSPAHSFTLVLPAYVIADPQTRARTERLIAASIPAHTRFQIRPVAPGVTVAAQSTLGVDMLLGGARPEGLGQGRAGLTFATDGPPSPDLTDDISQGPPGADRAQRRCSQC